MEIVVRSFHKSDWHSVANIYKEGIATGIDTFETEVPDWTYWNKKCRIVAIVNNIVVGFAVLSPVSNRLVYNGVAEVSV